MNHYTTFELANVTLYKSRRTLLQALHNNQKKETPERDKGLSAIWDARVKFGKRWVFRKEAIDSLITELLGFDPRSSRARKKTSRN